MGMYRYARTPHPTVIAVEMAAYIRDLAVSLTKHSSGMDASTSARVGNSSLGGNSIALPFRPEGTRSSYATAAARGATARRATAGRTARGTARDVRRRAPARDGRGDGTVSGAVAGTRSIQMGPKARGVTSRRRRRVSNRAEAGRTLTHRRRHARRGPWRTP